MKISFTLLLTVLGIDGINSLGTLTIKPDYDFQASPFNPEDLPSIKNVLVNAMIPPSVSSSSDGIPPPPPPPDLSLSNTQKEIEEKERLRASVNANQNQTNTVPNPTPNSTSALLEQIRQGKNLKKVEMKYNAPSKSTGENTGMFNIQILDNKPKGTDTSGTNGGKNTKNKTAVNESEWSDAGY